ncbi:MAG: TolC family protein [Reyranella sp.]|uniref:TolC family protein n=1 Tax=Reyranella sp. TaxID=1929291 RepID=UPI001ACEC03D|nr:TolC family protein [Reyranella sp.]MBN9086406.1 TolC family protein [Reyranella sp.]
MFLRAVWTLCATAVVCASPVAAQTQRASTLTLPQTLQRVVAVNPRLAAADRTIAMSHGRRQQAGALPNPSVGFDVDNFAPSGSVPGQAVETTLLLSQLVELGSKRDARVAAALGDYDAARYEREATRLELLSEATVAFIGALAAQRRIALLDRHVAALERLVPLMQRRLEAGASSPAEVTKIQGAIGFTRLERERSRVAQSLAQRELGVLMGLDTPDFTAVSGNLGGMPRLAPFDAIVKAIADNPQLMRWTAVRARRDADLLSARLKAVPDVTASVGWRRYGDTPENALRLGISMPIPVLDQNRGGIREAQELAQRTEAEREINRLTLIVTVGKAYDTAASALQQIDLLRRTVLPATRSTLSTIETGYEQGRFTVLEILDAYQRVADAELMEHDALNMLHTSLATIEGLTGSAAVPAQMRTR